MLTFEEVVNDFVSRPIILKAPSDGRIAMFCTMMYLVVPQPICLLK